MALDTSYLVETPEGIELQAELAGPVPRVLAYSIDLILRTLALALISVVLGFAGELGVGLMLLLAFLLEWFYPVLFEMYAAGQTPGKKQMGIVAVNDNLSSLTWSSSVLRNLLRVADFFPFGYLAGIVCMVSNANFQRLGDIAAGTLVIYKHVSHAAAGLPAVAPVAPSLRFTLDEQLAVIGLAQRSGQLSSDRQRELADILASALRTHGDAALTRLHGFARWMMGDR